MSQLIQVAIVDDQALVREGISGLISRACGFEVCWQASNGLEAVQKQQESRADVILLDVYMPVCNGVECIKRLRNQDDNTPVLVLTTFDDKEIFKQSIIAGANGFLLKESSLETLLYAIQKVMAGELYFSPILDSGFQNIANQPTLPLSTRLSKREVSLLKLMSAGYSNKEIGEMLNLATGTIKNLVSVVLDKLGCSDRIKAIAIAARLKLLDQ